MLIIIIKTLIIQIFFFFEVLFEGDSIELLCRAVGADALKGTILTWNISALNSNASIIITDGDFENTGLIQRYDFKI